ncbi:MAG: hypothetical protein NWR47_05995, partial [Aestuariivirgaceae bacterium]|nr:hypothetical protein [Aestuariivirgaceae bacterium]
GIGRDHLEGGAGRDVVSGGDGDDSLSGNDIYQADGAVDHLFGGAGADTFILFEFGAAGDVVEDWEAGVDHLAVCASFDSLIIEQVGDDVRIAADLGEIAIIKNALAVNFTAQDFYIYDNLSIV